MSFIELFESGSRARKLGHFSALVNIAVADGELHPDEESRLLRFARKFDISEPDYKEILKNPKKYPIVPPNSAEIRLKQLHDLFSIIYADHYIDEDEDRLLHRYAIAIGFPAQEAEEIIQKSIRIFSGNIAFEDYKYLVEKK